MYTQKKKRKRENTTISMMIFEAKTYTWNKTFTKKNNIPALLKNNFRSDKVDKNTSNLEEKNLQKIFTSQTAQENKKKKTQTLKPQAGFKTNQKKKK